MHTLRVILAILCFSLWVQETSAEFDATQLQTSIQKTIDAVKPAVVAIRGSRSRFSGVIVSPDGHVLSAGHAVSPGTRYQVILPDGRRFSARGKGSNPQADCALVQITTKVEDLPFVQIGDSSNLVTNQPCIGISFPGGQGTSEQPAVRFGRIVRGSRRGRMLQSTALMEPGDSGGALFDLDGRVIGIHSRIGRSMTQNFEVPINVYKSYWTELNDERSFTREARLTLGIQGREREDSQGITIEKVVEDSVADQSGLKDNDIITEINGTKTPTLTELREILANAAKKRLDKLTLAVKRKDEDLSLDADFSKALPPPKVELPTYENIDFKEPKPIRQLANLPREFSDLESKLDDACIEISSQFGSKSAVETLKITGTRIKDTDFILSKNSMVGENPSANYNGKKRSLEVLQRDTVNDLVLLEAPQTNDQGIELTPSNDDPPAGIFLIAPATDGAGQVSIVSAKTFRSRKEMSRGFLGVVPATFGKQEGAVLNEVRPDGAAKKAGLKVGDVVTKMNDTEIKTQTDMREFLTKLDPRVTIVAIVQRDGEELEKSITLGAFPSQSRHAADLMDKSGRRDGFSEVLLHDADLQPEKCGGPIFDLSGNFLGMNIARNSRVRSYALPIDVLKAFVDSHDSQHTDASDSTTSESKPNPPSE